MKTVIRLVILFAFVNLISVHAQPAPQGPQFSGAMDKLFGDNQAFSATMLMQMKDSSGGTAVMPGKFAFDAGKSRFEVDATKMTGSKARPEAAAHMKEMGMDEMVMISRPDLGTSYLVYPGLQSYAENPLKKSDTGAKPDDFKVETTELGKETVDGHPCVKNKVVVTDKDGVKHESTVWNATDLKNFPVKIHTTESGNDVVMAFQDIKLLKPDAGSFNPPSGYKKYDNLMEMMRDQMMKRMGGGMMPH